MQEYPNTPDERIFVFGSNLAGRHGAGAAKFALDYRGAIYGRGVGPQGQSFALPTLDADLKKLSLSEIAAFGTHFLVYTQEHPEQKFQLTAVGCGLAGFTNEQIAPIFMDAPSNVDWPPEWKKYEHQRTFLLDVPGTFYDEVFSDQLDVDDVQEAETAD